MTSVVPVSSFCDDVCPAMNSVHVVHRYRSHSPYFQPLSSVFSFATLPLSSFSSPSLLSISPPPPPPPLKRVNKVTQRLHYNDPLRKYVDIIIKKFPEEVQAEFNKGHDDYEDYRETSGEDSLCKSSLEKLLKQSMKAVRMSRSTHM